MIAYVKEPPVTPSRTLLALVQEQRALLRETAASGWARARELDARVHKLEQQLAEAWEQARLLDEAVKAMTPPEPTPERAAALAATAPLYHATDDGTYQRLLAMPPEGWTAEDIAVAKTLIAIMVAVVQTEPGRTAHP